MSDNYQTGGTERLSRLDLGMGFQVCKRGGSMKARHITVVGLALLVALLGGATQAISPRTGAVRATTASILTSAVIRQTSEKPPPVPKCFYTGSGYGTCEGYVIPTPGTVVLFTHPDKDGVFSLTGPAPLQTKDPVACGDAGCVYNHLNWYSSYGAAVPGAVNGTCKSNTTVCNVKVPPLRTWTPVFVRQNNNPALLYLLWNSGKPGGTITGYVRDRDDAGAPDASVGARGTTDANGEVDPTTGLYSINVPAGQYTLTPLGGPSTVMSPKFDPKSRAVSVAIGEVTHANFTLNGGLRVTLTFSQRSVLADGLTVVKGNIVTTEYGKPDADVTLSLRPQPSESGETAVTTGPRVVICDSTGSRIWPQDTPTSPLAAPVYVETDANGVYDFTMTIGTVPGSFVLNAWAKNASGQLMTTDLSATSPDETLTLTAPGNLTAAQFVSELAVLKSDAAATQALGAMTNNASSMVQTLVQLSGAGSKLGGLSYSLVSGSVSGGAAVLVYGDTTPPTISSAGNVTGSNDTVVLDPGEWVGTKLIPITTLNVVMQKGLLSVAPTFQQWSSGAKVPGWTLVAKNLANIASSSWQYNGWPYPSTTPGACY
jgi:hypothetical protein